MTAFVGGKLWEILLGRKIEVKKNSILSSKSVSYVLSVGKNLGCKEMPDENKGRGHLLLLQLLVHSNWYTQGHIRNWLHCSSNNNRIYSRLLRSPMTRSGHRHHDTERVMVI